MPLPPFHVRARRAATLLELAVAIGVLVSLTMVGIQGTLAALSQTSEAIMDSLVAVRLANETAGIRNSVRPGAPGSWLDANGYPATSGATTTSGPVPLNAASSGPIYRADRITRSLAVDAATGTDYYTYTVTVEYTQKFMGKGRISRRSATVRKAIAHL